MQDNCKSVVEEQIPEIWQESEWANTQILLVPPTPLISTLSMLSLSAKGGGCRTPSAYGWHSLLEILTPCRLRTIPLASANSSSHQRLPRSQREISSIPAVPSFLPSFPPRIHAIHALHARLALLHPLPSSLTLSHTHIHTDSLPHLTSKRAVKQRW